MKLFLVEMLRWGDRNNHSYPLGIFITETLAEKAAKYERDSRGGKYEPAIYEYDIAYSVGEENPKQPVRVVVDPSRYKSKYVDDIHVGDVVSVPAGGWVMGEVKRIEEEYVTVDIGDMFIDKTNLDVLYR